MKTIFIYGLTGKTKHAKSAKKIFNDLICFEYNSKFEQPIEEIANELSEFINSKTDKYEKINLIGISAGGLIASYYTKFLNPKKVSKLATVCSPLKGTYMTIFYSKKRKGIKEFSYNSKFLKKLNSKKLGKNKIINFYCFFDIAVPFNSGKGENPKFTLNFFHPLVQYDKNILKKIKKFFRKN